MGIPEEGLMRRAIELAARAKGMTRPNPCVGAVIVDDAGGILGEGFHRRAGMPHGEVEALRDAGARGRDVAGATMYVTLEPCNHRGRTGPCTEAIIRAGIRRVYIAARDPNSTARGGLEVLRDAGIEVHLGLCEQESLFLNAAFHTYHMLGRPLITLKWAMTLDGCTSLPSGDSKWVTSGDARLDVHRRRAAHDAVMAGIGTVMADDARLTIRIPEEVRATMVPPGFRHTRIVVDTMLRLRPDSAFLAQESGSRALVVCAVEADEARERVLTDAGAEVLRVHRDVHGVSIPDLMAHLYNRHIHSVYVEGGRTLAGCMVQHGLVDHVEAWIGPKLAGGGPEHLGPTRRTDPLAKMSDALPLHTLQLRQFAEDFLLEGWAADHLKARGV